jgi:hypothetical protein
VEKLLFFFILLDLWLVEKGYDLGELFWNMVAASREWCPGGAPTNDYSLLPQLTRRYAFEKNRRKYRMFYEATSPRFRYMRNFNITQIFQKDCKINL